MSPGGSLIACSSRLIVKLLLTGAGSFILGRRRAGKILSMLACPDGDTMACGHAHANICAGYLLMRFNCWRASTEIQGFAGMSTPTRSCPSLRKECLPYIKGNPREKSEEPKNILPAGFPAERMHSRFRYSI